MALATNIPSSCPAGDPIYTYDKGQLQSLLYPNGKAAKYTFDNNGNLEDLHYQRSDMSSVQRFRYAYDTNNMRKSMTDNDGVHDYTYDSLYQIIGATHPNVQRPLEAFEYDAVGNWLGGGRVHNELNQLTEDDSCWYSYDLDGNMTEKVSKSTNDTMFFVWDIENKLTEVRKPGMVAQYTYDALGRRMSKTVNGVTTQFRYDGENLIVEMDGNDSGTASYTYGPGIDNPLEMHRYETNFYYVKDGLGSGTALTDSTANVVKEYRYSVFGEILEGTGVSILNPFTYTGRECDAETELYYYRNRYYNPQIGRFISEDPIRFAAQDVTFYRYVGNSPMNAIDPYGLFRWHGNWGGPGWSAGQEKREGDLTWDDFSVPAVDARDNCYKGHDRCLWNCNREHGANECGEGSPASDCEENCDHELAQCLWRIPRTDKHWHKTDQGYPVNCGEEGWLFGTTISGFIH